MVWRRPGEPALALEFQCSPIGLERLAERTAGYRRLGVPVVWIMGRRYFARQPKALQAKFLAWSRQHGWHLWFLDVRAGRLALWRLGATTAITWYHSGGENRSEKAQAPVTARTAWRVGQALRHRDAAVMALQAASAAAHRNVGGVPWLVHEGPSGLIGLPHPEWQLRAWWLLAFDGQATIDRAAEAAFWRRWPALRTPLVADGQLLAAIAARWHAVLTASGAWRETATGWQLAAAPLWYPTLEAKLAARQLPVPVRGARRAR